MTSRRLPAEGAASCSPRKWTMRPVSAPHSRSFPSIYQREASHERRDEASGADGRSGGHGGPCGRGGGGGAEGADRPHLQGRGGGGGPARPFPAQREEDE